MKRTGIRFGIIFWALALAGAGCQREGDSAAIQQAIEKHLTSRPGLASENLILEMQEVQVEGDAAEAEVVFHSRSDPDARMSYHYELRKEGGEWNVASGRPSTEGTPHPSTEGGAEPEGSLPEGHPPVEEAPEQR